MNQQSGLVDIDAPLLHPVLDLFPVLALVMTLIDPKGYPGSAWIVSFLL